MRSFFSAHRQPRVGGDVPAAPPILLEGRRIGRQDGSQSVLPYSQPLTPEAEDTYRGPIQTYDFGPSAIHGTPGTNVSVNNNGQFYRPWREELAVSFAKTIGNFLGWPFRLLGRAIEGVVNAGIGIIKMMLIAVVAPTLIYTGLAMYEARAAGESSTAVAADIGKQGIGLVGAVLGGVWDGIFGSDEPDEGQEAQERPAK